MEDLKNMKHESCLIFLVRPFNLILALPTKIIEFVWQKKYCGANKNIGIQIQCLIKMIFHRKKNIIYLTKISCSVHLKYLFFILFSLDHCKS